MTVASSLMPKKGAKGVRPELKRKLGRLGLKHKVSESGVAAVLKAASEDPELLEYTSRSTLKRSLQETVHVKNEFGDLIETKTLEKVNKRGAHTFPVVNPVVLLCHCLSAFNSFAEHILDVYSKNPCTRDKPWRIALYSDEITPGNPKLSVNLRKAQAVYWSILELGEEAMTSEAQCLDVISAVRIWM